MKQVAQTIRQYADMIRDGQLSSVQLVDNCFKAISESEEQLRAWAYLDRDHAIAQAEAADEIRRAGEPTGALHGIPIGLKDIIDTADMPTQRGSPIYKDRQPAADAAVVEKLREAGAVILGKTVTTEFAYMHPPLTRNPHNHDYSPGGSSSGSAAAVAAGHVPLALGTQTNGSVIRPASFCGVYGFKPSRGILSRRGLLQTSATLDQIGVFSRDIGDLALLTDSMAGYDADDDACYLKPRPGMLAGYLSDVPIEPAFVWIDLPYADRYTDDLAKGSIELLNALGASVERIPAPNSFDALAGCHKTIYDYEIYRCLTTEREQHWQLLSDTAKTALDNAQKCDEPRYLEALEIRESAIQWFKQFFYDYDAILTPSAVTQAPLATDGHTGDPICCTLWTLCGLPCLSLPLLTSADDLPIGIQMVGAYNQDDRLLRSARWLMNALQSDNASL